MLKKTDQAWKKIFQITETNESVLPQTLDTLKDIETLRDIKQL